MKSETRAKMIDRDYSLMITKQKAWTISRAGGAAKDVPKKRALPVKITDQKTGTMLYYKCCRDAERAYGWSKGSASQAARDGAILRKRYKVEYAEGVK